LLNSNVVQSAVMTKAKFSSGNVELALTTSGDGNRFVAIAGKKL
jgi:hypothetical protein